MERRDLETVRYEKDGPVARVILNRPDKANAQNSAMVWDVENCLKDAEADYDVWQVAAAGDVAAWQKENVEHGYGPLPRRVAAQRAEAAARRAASRTARDGADS
jgi:hypothetical protein